MSEHIKTEHSMALMALAQGDPERQQAERHAASCRACQSALDEATTMLGWVDAYAPLAAVDPALKARIRHTVLNTQAPRGLSRTVSKRLLALGASLSLLLAWLSGGPGELAPALGLECVLFENLAAVGPFAIAAYLGVRGRITLEPLTLATVSMAGALAGQLLLHSRCPSHATPHLFAFHVVGVLLAAALGYAATLGLRGLRKA